MLGQLLQSLNAPKRTSSVRSSNPPVDSATDESHTTALLFPEITISAENDGNLDTLVHGLQNRKEATLDLQYPRDIRILIAQSGSANSQEILLFDSKPAPPPSPVEEQRQFHSRTSSRSEALPNAQYNGRMGRGTGPVPSIPEDNKHRRTLSSYSASSSAGLGAFQRAKLRRGSVSSVTSLEDELQSLQIREGDDVEKIALSCMFENATSSYKGSSTKIHIVPLASKPYDASVFSSSLVTDATGTSLGRPSSLVRRPSSLSKSLAPGESLEVATDVPKNRTNRRIVLVTRTFSVTWIGDEPSMDDLKSPRATQSQSGSESQGLPRSQTFRSAMYAITIILLLPVAPDSSPSTSRSGTFGRKTMRKDSRTSYISMASSFDSDRGPWRDQSFSPNLLTSMTSSDVDDRVDLIGRHWDIISRTLTSMQNLVQTKLLEVLKPMSRIRRNPRLQAMAFANDLDIKKMANDAASRVIRGIIIARAQTGHGRWTAWRDEAQWLKNWAGGRNEANFFQTVLSSFLGTHTEWLHTLAPKWYRRRYRELQRIHPYSDLSVPSRTVIVSSNKMVARRLIFVLATFLPAGHYPKGDASPPRPSTAMSFRAYSQSPPKLSNISRQESLRKSINRRTKANPTGRPLVSRPLSIATDGNDDSLTSDTKNGDTKSPDRLFRPKLVMTELDSSLQKGESATGITPSVILAPHFSRQPSLGHISHSRTSSSASTTLVSPIQRSGSPGSESQWKWGSFRNLLGGLGSRRGSTSETADVSQTTDEGLGIVGLLPEGTSKLEQMIDELHGEGPPLGLASPDLEVDVVNKAQSKPVDIPLKMSVNKKDGVIDVQVPLLDGSPISPAAIGDRHHHSGSSAGGSSAGQTLLITMSPKDPERPPNVSGWIDTMHPDFTMQAVRPYSDILKDVKAAMSAEPNPQIPNLQDSGSVEKWLDICTTLVADADSLTIKRIKLRRLVRFMRQPSAAVVTPSLYGIPPGRSLYGNPYSHLQLNTLVPPGVSQFSLPGQSAMAAALMAELTMEENFEEETIVEFDQQLANALDKAISLSSLPEKTFGLGSRANSLRGRPIEASLQNDVNTERVHSTGRMALEASNSTRDTRAIITGVLENLTANIARERREDSNQHPHDSILKEGIRSWMNDVETRVAAMEATWASTDNQSRRLKHESSFTYSPSGPMMMKQKQNGHDVQSRADEAEESDSVTPRANAPTDTVGMTRNESS